MSTSHNETLRTLDTWRKLGVLLQFDSLVSAKYAARAGGAWGAVFEGVRPDTYVVSQNPRGLSIALHLRLRSVG